MSFILKKPIAGQKTYRTLFAILIFFSLSAIWIPFQSQAQILALEPEVVEYIREALKNSPDLESWRAKMEAAQQRTPQAGAWSDPMFAVGMMNLPVNSFDLNQEGMTAVWLNISQSIPLTGKYGIRADIAAQKAGISAYDLRYRQLSIARDIAQSWYDWGYLQYAAAALDTTIYLLTDLTEIARIKYETGKGLQQDILRLETETARMEDKKVRFTQMAISAGRKLAVLLGRDPSALPNPPDRLQDVFKKIDRNELIAQALDYNPRLAAAETSYEISGQAVDLAKKSWFPDLKIGVGYGFREDADNGMERPDFFSAAASLTLPVFGSRKQGPAVQEARASQRRAEAQLQQEKLQLRLQIETLIDKDERLTEQIRLYRQSIEPQSEATLAAATSAYSVGKVDVEALVMAQNTLIGARLERQSRILEKLKVRTNLTALIGSDNLVQ